MPNPPRVILDVVEEHFDGHEPPPGEAKGADAPPASEAKASDDPAPGEDKPSEG